MLLQARGSDLLRVKGLLNVGVPGREHRAAAPERRPARRPPARASRRLAGRRPPLAARLHRPRSRPGVGRALPARLQRGIALGSSREPDPHGAAPTYGCDRSRLPRGAKRRHRPAAASPRDHDRDRVAAGHAGAGAGRSRLPDPPSGADLARGGRRRLGPAGQLRRPRRLQLPGHAGLVRGASEARGHAPDRGVERLLQALRLGKARARVVVPVRRGRRALPVALPAHRNEGPASLERSCDAHLGDRAVDRRAHRQAVRRRADAALRHRRAGALRRRVARLPPRGDPARARPRFVGRAPEPQLEGSRDRSGRPRGRARRPRPGRADGRDHALQERRRDDDPGGRSPRKGADAVPQAGAVPAAVDELQRRRQPDGVEGRGPLAALALRCGAGRRRGRPHRLRRPARGLPRLVQRRRNLRARAARSAARRLLCLPELAPRRLLRRHDDAPGVLRRQRREAGVLDLDLRDVTCRSVRSPGPSIATGTTDARRRTRFPTSRECSRSSAGRGARAAPSQTRMCRCTAWSSYFHASGHQARRFREFTGT